MLMKNLSNAKRGEERLTLDEAVAQRTDETSGSSLPPSALNLTRLSIVDIARDTLQDPTENVWTQSTKSSSDDVVADALESTR